MIDNLASASFFEHILPPAVVAALGFLFILFRGKGRISLCKQTMKRNAGLNFFASFYRNSKDFFIRYPAVLSGCIIYSYLFISTIKFFLDEKKTPLGGFDIFQHFDGLLWMWLLAVALVKIIDIRTKLHQKETTQLVQQQELEMKKMQLKTLVEIVRGLQHEVNNPLTIIMMIVGKLERRLGSQQELRENAKTIRSATERIAKTLDSFTRAKKYETSDSPIGQIASPPALETTK